MKNLIEQNDPKVSVCMIAYNHAKYIEQAIECIIHQKITFVYEIVIGEDCSPDNTRQKCIELQAKYPDKIRLILPEKNLGMITNFINTIYACKGDYIAICEGDDFWNNTLKLQQQIDFLEANPSFSFSCHNSHVINENSKIPPRLFNKRGSRVNLEEIIKDWKIPTCSIIFRRSMLELPDWYYSTKNPDYALTLLLAIKGPIHYIDEPLSTYRQHTGGLTYSKSNSNVNSVKKLIELFSLIEKDMPESHKIFIAKRKSSLRRTLKKSVLIERYPFLYSFSPFNFMRIVRRFKTRSF